MADASFVEFTEVGLRTQWKATVRWSPDACANFSLHAAGPGLRYLKQGMDRWLVCGEPRPERPPATADGEPDPAHALIHAFDSRGQSALRHTEGRWALLHWDAGRGELFLAVDRLARCSIFVQCSATSVQVANRADLLDLSDIDGEARCPPVTRLRPGTHLRFASDGTQHGGFHGSWREAGVDRRPWPLILGEFEERLKSVLRLLAESADLIVLAEHPAASALLASALRTLPGAQPSLLWVRGWAEGDRATWSRVAERCGMRFIDASELSATHADGSALLAHAARALAPLTAPQVRPQRLLSAAGFDLLVPGGASFWQRLTSWMPWTAQDAQRAGQRGSAVAEAFSTRWQEALEGALADSALHATWPILDETVALFLVNLPARLREGGSWSGDFRTCVLRSALPAGLRDLRG